MLLGFGTEGLLGARLCDGEEPFTQEARRPGPALGANSRGERDRNAPRLTSKQDELGSQPGGLAAGTGGGEEVRSQHLV